MPKSREDFAYDFFCQTLQTIIAMNIDAPPTDQTWLELERLAANLTRGATKAADTLGLFAAGAFTVGATVPSPAPAAPHAAPVAPQQSNAFEMARRFANPSDPLKSGGFQTHAAVPVSTTTPAPTPNGSTAPSTNGNGAHLPDGTHRALTKEEISALLQDPATRELIKSELKPKKEKIEKKPSEPDVVAPAKDADADTTQPAH